MLVGGATDLLGVFVDLGDYVGDLFSAAFRTAQLKPLWLSLCRALPVFFDARALCFNASIKNRRLLD